MYNIFGSYINDLKGISRINNLNLNNSNNFDNIIIKSLINSSNIHKQVRNYLYNYLKPGIKLLDIAKIIETKTTELSKNMNTINNGIGFPASLSLNNCAAHFHPEYNNNISFNDNDVIKIDFGTENNGWITDCAFTVCFNDKYMNLLNAVKEGTYTGIKNAGIDVRIGEWGGMIQEVIESYEITLNGKTKQIRVINNLGGHNIINGIIHGGMFLSPVYNNNTAKFKEGVYAVETFGSTGDNQAVESQMEDTTLYRLNPSLNKISLEPNILFFYNKLNNNFKTLPFTDRYVQNYDVNYKKYLKELIELNLIFAYPPLYVNSEDYTAQYEHTIYISENKKIVFSADNDY